MRSRGLLGHYGTRYREAYARQQGRVALRRKACPRSRTAVGHKRSLAHCEHLSVLAHEKKKPSRAPDVALCLMQGHTLNITFAML